MELSFSLAIFPGRPGLDSTSFWMLLELRMIDGGGGISWCYDVQNSSQIITTISFVTGRMLFLSPNQQCQSTEGKNCVELSYMQNTCGCRSM